jgi:hypothetical protein
VGIRVPHAAGRGNVVRRLSGCSAPLP